MKKYEITARIIEGVAPREVSVLEWAYDAKDALMQSAMSLTNELKRGECVDRYLRVGPPMADILAQEETSRRLADTMSGLIGKKL